MARQRVDGAVHVAEARPAAEGAVGAVGRGPLVHLPLQLLDFRLLVRVVAKALDARNLLQQVPLHARVARSHHVCGTIVRRAPDRSSRGRTVRSVYFWFWSSPKPRNARASPGVATATAAARAARASRRGTAGACRLARAAALRSGGAGLHASAASHSTIAPACSSGWAVRARAQGHAILSSGNCSNSGDLSLQSGEAELRACHLRRRCSCRRLRGAGCWRGLARTGWFGGRAGSLTVLAGPRQICGPSAPRHPTASNRRFAQCQIVRTDPRRLQRGLPERTALRQPMGASARARTQFRERVDVADWASAAHLQREAPLANAVVCMAAGSALTGKAGLCLTGLLNTPTSKLSRRNDSCGCCNMYLSELVRRFSACTNVP